MKLLSYGKDGGPDSTVWGYWLIEAKGLFSIALLCLENGSRDAFHNHAFNAVSWLLSGELVEVVRGGTPYVRRYQPSFRWIWTPRERFHRVSSVGRSWVLTFRGPWRDKWNEETADGRRTTLTHGRIEC